MQQEMPDLRQFVKFGRKIVAVGRNYKAHAAELGNAVPEDPLLFLKPTTSYIEQGQSIVVPSRCSELHHEVELGVVIGRGGKDIPEPLATSHIGGYTLALDMTARDLQNEAKKKGYPWSVAKGYDTFCPVSHFISPDKIELGDTRLWLKVDGQMKQDGNTRDMVFSVPYLISFISRIFTLEVGDVILTGTPEGVGPVKPGQTITAGIGGGVVEVTFPVVK